MDEIEETVFDSQDEIKKSKFQIKKDLKSLFWAFKQDWRQDHKERREKNKKEKEL